jgi:adenylate cyclase
MSAFVIHKRKGPSFRLKIGVLAVFVAIVPVVAVGLATRNVNKDALTAANATLLESIIDHLGSTTNATVSDADTALVSISAVIDSPPELRAAVVETALDVATTIREVGFYDEHGALVTSVDNTRTLHPPPLPERLPHIASGTRFGPTVVSHGQAYVLRVRTADPPTQTVAAYVSLHRIAERAVEVGLSHLPGGQIVVVNPERLVIADSQGEYVGKAFPATSFAILTLLDRHVLATKTLLATGDYERADGTQVVGALRSIDGTPFTIAIEIPHAQVYRSLVTVRHVLVAAMLIAIAAAVLAAVLLARHLTYPIKALVAFAGELSHRRFESRVTVMSNDELGVLGTALEQAASELAASDEQIREQLAIRSDLGRYLPNHLVDDIVARRRSLALGGERREISVLFADVVGFTRLAERESAETVVTLLNELFTILTEIVFRHGGTVDKFVGDCVMAVWGGSDTAPDHADRAIAAALDMQRWLETGNELWLERFGVAIELAIGVNSGEAIVGNFGSDSRMEFTAIGDVVNVAARLESIARPNQILTTTATRDRVADTTGFVGLGMRPIIGKAQPIEIWDVRL